jgi:hypothetical protein
MFQKRELEDREVGMLTFDYDVEATGTDPFENKAITIQYRRGSHNHIFKIWDYNNSECELLLSFLKEWKNIPRQLLRGGDYFVTYNMQLDAPFLLTRCLLNDLDRVKEWKDHLWSNLIHGPDFLDLYQLLGDELTSHDDWGKTLAHVPSKFRNSEIPQFYENQRYSDIEEYVNDELFNLERIYYAIIFVELEKLRAKLKV